MCSFQHDPNEIMQVIADYSILPLGPRYQDTENVRAIKAKQCQFDNKTKAITDLEALYNNIMKNWSNVKLHYNIEHIQYAKAISVNIIGGTLLDTTRAAQSAIRYCTPGWYLLDQIRKRFEYTDFYCTILSA